MSLGRTIQQNSGLPQRRLPAPFHIMQGRGPSDMTAGFRKIFLDPSSMTAILRQQGDPQMQVQVLRHAWDLPNPVEASLADVHNDQGIVREVALYCQDQPWLYARSFFPRRLVRGHGNHFSRLGSRPLGELLFNNAQAYRSAFTVAKLLPGHSEYHSARALLPSDPPHLWARRSQFHLPSGILVLTEVFLPAMEAGVSQIERGRE